MISAVSSVSAATGSFAGQIDRLDPALILHLSGERQFALPRLIPADGRTLTPTKRDRQANWRAARALTTALAGRQAAITATGADRFGRVLGRCLLDDGELLEHFILRQGWAWFYPDAQGQGKETTGATGADGETAALRAAEEAARNDRRGHWGRGDLRHAAAEPFDGRQGRMQIVQGRVQRSRRINGRLHLEFGADWRQDFTAALPRKSILEGQELTGRWLTLRGWVRHYHGPFMDLRSHGAIT